MEVLLDENLPKQLKADFGPEYDVRTVRDMDWLGKKNGELPGLIVFNGFDFSVTIKAPLYTFLIPIIRLLFSMRALLMKAPHSLFMCLFRLSTPLKV